MQFCVDVLMCKSVCVCARARVCVCARARVCDYCSHLRRVAAEEQLVEASHLILSVFALLASEAERISSLHKDVIDVLQTQGCDGCIADTRM